MQLFYTPNIETDCVLTESESHHCVKVLRMSVGDKIYVTDGKGSLFTAEIIDSNSKHCAVKILEKECSSQPRNYKIEIAIAPTKNIDRIEWFAEKCTEFGIDAITFINCRFSERKDVKTERIEKVIVAAMKQSLHYDKPELKGVIPFKDIISRPFDGDKFIAHCHNGEKSLLKDICVKGRGALVLIGPEGDFSKEEVIAAKTAGFREISLGDSRLRTETAGIAACHTIYLINQ